MNKALPIRVAAIIRSATNIEGVRTDGRIVHETSGEFFDGSYATGLTNLGVG
jgi:hypothetical protein